MKKLSGLIALLLCVIIGGVYANWAYSASDDIQDKYLELSLGITEASQTGANGEYTITSNAKFVIDQKEGTNHVAELRVESTDSEEAKLTIKFTPFAAASINVKRDGVPTEVAFTTGNTFVYKVDSEGNYDSTIANESATKVFGFFNESDGAFNEENIITWTKVDENNDGLGEYFYVEYDAAALLEQVFLNPAIPGGNLVLDTYVEYAAFQQALLHAGNIIVKVSDGIDVLSGNGTVNPSQPQQ